MKMTLESPSRVSIVVEGEPHLSMRRRNQKSASLHIQARQIGKKCKTIKLLFNKKETEQLLNFLAASML